MPVLISKEEALKRLRVEIPHSDCLMCFLNGNSKLVVFENEYVVAFLSAFPRYWGHCIVSLKRHIESTSELTDIEYDSLMKVAKKIAVIVERNYTPQRVYIAMLGAEENMINTCPHIHVNVLPVLDKNMRPSDVLTWENGIYSGSIEEWQELKECIIRDLSS